jgi:hypothetical protein
LPATWSLFVMVPSEKALGKRRAIDGSKETLSAARIVDVPPMLVVRFSEGDPDLRLSVGPTTTVRDIKGQVRVYT